MMRHVSSFALVLLVACGQERVIPTGTTSTADRTATPAASNGASAGSETATVATSEKKAETITTAPNNNAVIVPAEVNTAQPNVVLPTAPAALAVSATDATTATHWFVDLFSRAAQKADMLNDSTVLAGIRSTCTSTSPQPCRNSTFTFDVDATALEQSINTDLLGEAAETTSTERVYCPANTSLCLALTRPSESAYVIEVRAGEDAVAELTLKEDEGALSVRLEQLLAYIESLPADAKANYEAMLPSRVQGAVTLSLVRRSDSSAFAIGLAIDETVSATWESLVVTLDKAPAAARFDYASDRSFGLQLGFAAITARFTGDWAAETFNFVKSENTPFTGIFSALLAGAYGEASYVIQNGQPDAGYVELNSLGDRASTISYGEKRQLPQTLFSLDATDGSAHTFTARYSDDVFMISPSLALNAEVSLAPLQLGASSLDNASFFFTATGRIRVASKTSGTRVDVLKAERGSLTVRIDDNTTAVKNGQCLYQPNQDADFASAGFFQAGTCL